MLGGPGLKYLEKLAFLVLPWKSWIILMQCGLALDLLEEQALGKL